MITAKEATLLIQRIYPSATNIKLLGFNNNKNSLIASVDGIFFSVNETGISQSFETLEEARDGKRKGGSHQMTLSEIMNSNEPIDFISMMEDIDKKEEVKEDPKQEKKSLYWNEKDFEFDF